MTSETRRLLFLDIETKPAVVHAWKLQDQNIALNQVVDPGGTICFSALWEGSDELLFHADWIDGHATMIEMAYRLLREAETVVTYYGDKFDLPKLRGEFLMADLPPLRPNISIDLHKTMKKFGLLSNKLAFVGPLLTGEGKEGHEGHALWVKVMAGEPEAQATMERYCRQDVRLLERLYDRMLPYLDRGYSTRRKAAPAPPPNCGACGSLQTRRRGKQRKRGGWVELFQCLACCEVQQGGRVEAP